MKQRAMTPSTAIGLFLLRLALSLVVLLASVIVSYFLANYLGLLIGGATVIFVFGATAGMLLSFWLLMRHYSPKRGGIP